MDRFTFTAMAALALCGLLTPGRGLRAAALVDGLSDIQHDWETIRYEAPAAEREKRFELLATKVHKLSESLPDRSEPLIWEGIVLSSWAGEKGGLGALNLAKQAKSLYERALQIDATALDGSAYNSLGVLYYKVPGWPLGFGDKAKAGELLQKGLAANPRGIDANYFYGEYLVETDHAAQAVPYLERALQAPARPGRPLADRGRREEAQVLLAKLARTAR